MWSKKKKKKMTFTSLKNRTSSHFPTHSTIVRNYPWLELIGGAGVNDDSIGRLNFDGLRDVFKLFIVPSDGVFAVVSDGLTCAVTQQT